MSYLLPVVAVAARIGQAAVARVGY